MSGRGVHDKTTLEAGLTCPRCGDLCPWDSVVCVECGTRLIAAQEHRVEDECTVRRNAATDATA